MLKFADKDTEIVIIPVSAMFQKASRDFEAIKKDPKLTSRD